MCVLCTQSGGDILYQHEKFRVIQVEDNDYPGLCRVIWTAHVKEMTDLSVEERVFLMNAVWHVESAMREVMQPEKINLASLGNVVPHLHWHVIPRYVDDVHFPDPVWAPAKRNVATHVMAQRAAFLPLLRAAIAQRIGNWINNENP